MKGPALILVTGAIVALTSCTKSERNPTSPSLPIGQTSPTELTPVDGRIAFSSTRDGQPAIYVAEGLDVRRLTDGDRPSWSPNGQQIAFQRGPLIYVMNADGSGERYLTQGFNPAWSRDGTRIVFSAEESGGRGGSLFVMNGDGSGITKLVDSGFAGGSDVTLQMADWSPNGRTIAFVRANYEEAWEIYLVNADGSNLRRLSTGPSRLTQSEPAWSPDGSQIAFDGFSGIEIMNEDGSGSRIVIAGKSAFYPDWTPDGRLVFTRMVGPGPDSALGGSELRIFLADGGAERRLVPQANTTRRYDDRHVAWAP